MNEKNQQLNTNKISSSHHKGLSTTESPLQGIDNKIDFNNAIIPFIQTEEIVEEKELQEHQQNVAKEIQLQLISPLSSDNNNETKLSCRNHFLQRFIGTLTSSHYILIMVLTVHVFIIAIALLYGRFDISGMTNVPVAQSNTKPLPPLKSYVISQEEYDKLVERSQVKQNAQSVELLKSETESKP
ncbi:hypothetical protein ACWXWU_10490 [Shewanella sp. A14]